MITHYTSNKKIDAKQFLRLRAALIYPIISNVTTRSVLSACVPIRPCIHSLGKSIRKRGETVSSRGEANHD